MGNKEQTYKQWLSKQIDKTEKAYAKAEYNHQETGHKRYYTAMQNKENELRALQDSLNAESGTNKHIESWQRGVSSTIDIAENAKMFLLPEEALEGVIKELYKLRLLY